MDAERWLPLDLHCGLGALSTFFGCKSSGRMTGCGVSRGWWSRFAGGDGGRLPVYSVHHCASDKSSTSCCFHPACSAAFICSRLHRSDCHICDTNQYLLCDVVFAPTPACHSNYGLHSTHCPSSACLFVWRVLSPSEPLFFICKQTISPVSTVSVLYPSLCRLLYLSLLFPFKAPPQLESVPPNSSRLQLCLQPLNCHTC